MIGPPHKRAANCLGVASLIFSVIPVVYIFHADVFPALALTEAVVLIGGMSGGLLMALVAGFIGSRWWFIATLGPLIDVFCIWWFSP
jgi:hypothetical protein